MEIVNQYPFEFYGSQLIAYRTNRNELLLPLRDLCEAIGLNASTETRRTRRDAVLGDALVMITAPVVNCDGVGQERKFTCLPLRLLPYWVGMINTKRLKPPLREKIVRFQRQLIDVTWAAFRSQMLPADVLTMMDKRYSRGSGNSA